MLRGEQTQNVLKDVEAKTEELNRHILPPDVKVRPFYDRSQLVDLTTDTVEANLLRGMVLVLIVLIFFLVSFRAAIIVALTVPLSLLFAFIVLHAHDVAANLLSIGAIDFGIIIDGTVVMIENIYRELALREGQQYNLHEVILAAAKDVDRPIFYSVAVILAGYLPIYALSGPSGKLFHPMAETMSFALVGALILTLTLVPVLASYWFKSGVREKQNRAFEWMKRKYAGQLDWALARPKTTILIATLIFGATLLLIPFIGGEYQGRNQDRGLWPRRRPIQLARVFPLHPFEGAVLFLSHSAFEPIGSQHWNQGKRQDESAKPARMTWVSKGHGVEKFSRRAART